MSRWVFNDGGRAAAGFGGRSGDCVCRAIAIATDTPYTEVYDLIMSYVANERLRKRQRRHSHPLLGVDRRLIRRLMADLGWEWTPMMGIGTGTRVHLEKSELPAGPLVASCSRHLVAVIDGVIQDTHDPSRGGSRCVYGVWRPSGSAPIAPIGALAPRLRPSPTAVDRRPRLVAREYRILDSEHAKWRVVAWENFDDVRIRWDTLVIEVPLHHDLAERSPAGEAMLKRAIDLGLSTLTHLDDLAFVSTTSAGVVD